jgi:CheY-like chemotaxis protein/HPt (histidine-containing phosphotransfer) domain-containing protein
VGKERKLIAILCSIPVCIVILLGVVLLIETPDGPHLVLALAATLATIALSLAIDTILNRHFIQPIRDLSLAISREPPAIRTDAAALAPIAHAIRGRLDGQSARLKEAMQAAAAERARLRGVVVDLEHAAEEAARLQTERMQALERQLTDRAQLTTATDVPLRNIVGRINALHHTAGPHLREIIQSSKQLELLTRELNQSDYLDCQPDRFDLRQLCDDAIATLAPVSQPRSVDVLPDFETTGDTAFVANVPLLRALLFNYLLEYLRLTPDHTQLLLAAKQLGLDHIAVSVSSEHHLAATPTLRVNELLHRTGGHYDGGILHIPVDRDPTPSPRFDCRALVATIDATLELSLTHRLQSMGVTVITDSYDVDLCVSDEADESEIMALIGKLRNDTRVLLCGNRLVVNHPRVQQVSSPPQHDELVMALCLETDPAAGPLVLIVDDNEANLRLLAINLKDLGCDVIAAHDGEQALQLAATRQPAIAIVDAHMPGLEGSAVIAALRARRGKQMPVYASTASEDQREERLLLRSGANAVLRKPVSKARLAQILAIPYTADDADPPRSNRASTSPMLFDPALALRLSNNRADLADELLEVLMEELPADHAHINAAWTDQDHDQFVRLIHRLHGGIQYCGVPRLRHALDNLDIAARSGQTDNIRFALAAFNSEVVDLIDWYDPDQNYFGTSIL